MSEQLTGYERGYFVAYQRAISRQQLGLPLEIGAETDDGDFVPFIETAEMRVLAPRGTRMRVEYPMQDIGQ